MALKRTFEEDLQRAVAFHGHMCAGQIIGTRLCRLALEYFGIKDPDTYRDLICVAESDRCLTDTVVSVAGCKPGRRRLKMVDLGKMAASFYDMQTKAAIRIATKVTPQPASKEETYDFFMAFTDDELFSVEEIELPLTQYDLPGKSRVSIVCPQCGEKVVDGRFVQVGDENWCQTCASGEAYYRTTKKVSFPLKPLR